MRVWAPLGGGLAFVLQGFVWLPLGAAWAGAYDVSGGDCGYNGTCSDAHSLTVAGVGWLLLIAAEIVTGASFAWTAWRRQRNGGGHADLLGLLAVRGVIAVAVGCAASWALAVQAGVVNHVAMDRYPASDALQGRFFMTWNERAMAIEGLAALVSWPAIVLLRRSRARPSPRTRPRTPRV